MTTNPEDHPRAAEAWEAAKFMGEMAAAEARQTWEANEAYRREHEAELLAEVTAAMRAEDRSEEEIEEDAEQGPEQAQRLLGRTAGRTPATAGHVDHCWSGTRPLLLWP